jgi:CRP/FNR family transcriptional regulator, cyclic AMP receptor protein
MSTTANLLAEVPLFALMDDDERAALAEILELRHFDKGDTIFAFGDAGDALYVIRSGVVQVFVENNEGEKIIVGENSAGEIFGEISLLDGGPRTATAVATEDTDVFELERKDLEQMLRRYPHAGMDLLTVMGRRLRATDELLRTHVTRNLNVEEEERLTFGQRVADRVAAFGGSWTFIITFGVVLAVWVVLNSLVFAIKPFDPYPYILLNLVLSMLAALQAPVIMMSQNRQSAKDRLKGDLDYEVNLKAELEVAQLHSKVDRIYETMSAALLKMEKERAPRATGVFNSPKP